jgi:uncharacterized protein YqeY
MIREKIYDDIQQAMRDKNSVKLDALRFVWARIKELEIDKKSELTDEEVEKLLIKEVKSRKEAIEQFRANDRDDLVEEEEGKLVFLEALLPEMMSEEEIIKVVDEVIVSAGKDFGQVMGQVMGRVKGKADGGMVNRIVREKLS